MHLQISLFFFITLLMSNSTNGWRNKKKNALRMHLGFHKLANSMEDYENKDIGGTEKIKPRKLSKHQRNDRPYSNISVSPDEFSFEEEVKKKKKKKKKPDESTMALANKEQKTGMMTIKKKVKRISRSLPDQDESNYTNSFIVFIRNKHWRYHDTDLRRE